MYVLIPFFMALMLSLMLFTDEHFDLFGLGLSRLLFVGYVVPAIGVGIAGFVMAVIVSLVSKNTEMTATLFSILITCFLYIILYNIIFPPFTVPGALKYVIMQTILDLAFLSVFAIIGAWLVIRRRHHRHKVCAIP